MKKTFKRLLLYISGMFILAIGINISKAAQLGISPVSSVPYAVELIWGLDLGKANLFFYIMLIIIQILLLRKNYKPLQLLQILCTYAFSFFITYTGRNYLLSWLPLPTFYIMKLIYLSISIMVIGIGVYFYLLPKYPPLPAEGLTNAIVDLSKGKLKFANVKVAVDTSMVVVSAILSLVFLGGLKTVREGTFLAALLIGKVVGFMSKRYNERFVEWLEK